MDFTRECDRGDIFILGRAEWPKICEGTTSGRMELDGWMMEWDGWMDVPFAVSVKSVCR